MLKREKHAADYLDGDVHDCDEGDINNVDEFDNSNDDNSHDWCLLKQNLGLFLGVETSLRRGSNKNLFRKSSQGVDGRKFNFFCDAPN